MVFDAELKLPADVRQCCYRPINISFHFFKPDGVHDDLFAGTFYTIKYDRKERGFNHDVDVDYMVQQRIVNHAIFSAQIHEARDGNNKRDKSILDEKQYLALINQATELYNSQHFYASRRLFVEAQKIRPGRMYPQYKLEDIRTELERFENRAQLLGVNVDSIIQRELNFVQLEKEELYIAPYVPLTQQQIEQIFRQEVENQIKLMAQTPQEANRLLGLMKEFFREDFAPQQVADNTQTIIEEPYQRIVDISRPTTREPEPIAPIETPIVETPSIVETQKPIEQPTPITETTPIVETKPIEQSTPITETAPIAKTPVVAPTERPVTTPRPQPTQEIKVVDFNSYQDSLRRKYPEERTVEYSQDAHRKVTRVIMNDGKFVEVFARIEHSWGATYYYIEEYPSGYQSIGYSAFMNRTRLYELEDKK
jgi:hypothetical protein